MLLADHLLHADNLHGQHAFVHETSAKSKALQAAWRAAIELSGKVGQQEEYLVQPGNAGGRLTRAVKHPTALRCSTLHLCPNVAFLLPGWSHKP